MPAIRSVMFGLLTLSVLFFADGAEAAFSKATYHGKAFCPKGSFFDPRKGGECWSCPSGSIRTVSPVTSTKACKIKARLVHKRAKRGKKTLNPTKCKGKWFWDAIKGGGCWTCEGYNRTARAVTSSKACSRRVKAKPRKATFVRKFGCGKGRFFDPRKGGQCWSCPSGMHRTVQPVTSARACSRSVGGIIGIPKGAACRKLVTAMSKGRDGFQDVVKAVEKVAKPFEGQLKKIMRQAKPNIQSPKELDNLLRKALRPVIKHRQHFAELNQVARRMYPNRQRLLDAMLNPNLVCDGDGRRLVRELERLGFGPRKRAGLLDGLLIGEAHAASRSGKHFALSLGYTFRPPGPKPGVASSITFVRNYENTDERLFFSTSPFAYFTTRPGFEVSLSVYYFPNTTMNNFDLIDQLGFEFALSPGKYFDDTVKRVFSAPVAGIIHGLPGGFIFTSDPLFRETPGIGTTLVSVPDKTADGLGRVDVEFSWDVTAQLRKLK